MDIRKFGDKDLDKILVKINSGVYSDGWVRSTLRDLVKYIRWSAGHLAESEEKNV